MLPTEGETMSDKKDKTKNTTEIQWFWPFDKKMHTIRISTDAEDVNFDEIKKAMDKIISDQEDQCKLIYFLGISLTGSPAGARGFLWGWLMRSLKDEMEKVNGKWNIKHDEEEKTDSEVQSYLVKTLREMADIIEKDDEFKSTDAPVIKDSEDGTNLFK